MTTGSLANAGARLRPQAAPPFFYQDAIECVQEGGRARQRSRSKPRQHAGADPVRHQSSSAKASGDGLSSLLLHMQSKGGGDRGRQPVEGALRCAPTPHRAPTRPAKNERQQRPGCWLTSMPRTSRCVWLEKKNLLTLENAMLNLWSTTEHCGPKLRPRRPTSTSARSERSPGDFRRCSTRSSTPPASQKSTAAGDRGLELSQATTMPARSGTSARRSTTSLPPDQRQGGDPDKPRGRRIDAGDQERSTQSMAEERGLPRTAASSWIAMCDRQAGQHRVRPEEVRRRREAWLLAGDPAARPDLRQPGPGPRPRATKRGILFLRRLLPLLQERAARQV